MRHAKATNANEDRFRSIGSLQSSPVTGHILAELGVGTAEILGLDALRGPEARAQVGYGPERTDPPYRADDNLKELE